MRAHLLLALAFVALAYTGHATTPAPSARYILLYVHTDGGADAIDYGLTLSDCATKTDSVNYFCELQKN